MGQVIAMTRKTDEQRTQLRRHLYLLEQMRIGTDPVALRVRVRDVSATGLMAECDLPLAVGEQVTITLRRCDPVTGRIAWVSGSRFGVSFDAAIDPAVAQREIRLEQTQPVAWTHRRPGMQPQALSAIRRSVARHWSRVANDRSDSD